MMEPITLSPNIGHRDSSGSTDATSFPRIWLRPLAVIIDALLLGLVGFLLGLGFFDQLASLGGWGRLVGFVIALSYFGILNSRIGHGQTIGKRLLGIRVLRLKSSYLTLSASMVRYSSVGIPFFANGFSLPISRTPMLVIVLLSIVIFGVGGTVIYLFLFNRPTRRSLHDFIAGSIVVRKGTEALASPRLWRGHLAILAGIWALFMVVGILAGVIANQLGMSDLRRVLEAVESSSSVRSAGVFSGRSWGPQGGGTYFKVTALLSDRPTSFEHAADDIAAVVFEEYPQVMQTDELWIGIAYGYDIGIARSYRTLNMVLRPQEWLDRLGTGAQRPAV